MPRAFFVGFMLLGVVSVLLLSLLSPPPATTLAAPSGGSEGLLVCSAEFNTQIPDQNGAGINIPIQVTDTAPIEDLDLIIDLDHSYVGDLEIYLSNGSITSTILRRPNNGAGQCKGDNLEDVVANDQVSGALNLDCNDVSGGAPAYTPNGNYRPGDPPNGTVLGAYNGASTFGEWTLNVKDVGTGGDNGTFQNWCLRFTVPALTPTPTTIPATRTPGPTPTSPILPTFAATRTPLPTLTPLPPGAQSVYAPLIIKEPPPLTCQTLEDEVRYPNNNAFEAFTSPPICIGQPLTGYHTEADNPDDIYRLVVPGVAGSQVPLDIYLNVPDINLSLLLYDANIQSIAQANTPGTVDEMLNPTVVPGTYYVRVYRIDAATSTQPYELSVTTRN